MLKNWLDGFSSSLMFNARNCCAKQSFRPIVLRKCAGRPLPAVTFHLRPDDREADNHALPDPPAFFHRHDETIDMNANTLAWMKGAAAFLPGDTLDDAKEKAAEQGYRPCADGYAAFVTAFAREVRLYRATAPKKTAPILPSNAESYSAGGLAAA